MEYAEKPWIEKYRPEAMQDIVGNQEIINQLREIAKKGNIPNMILTGPPGTGKTTSVLAIARELLGESFKKAVIELNASDERGIDTVRERIKGFAAQKVHLPEGRHKLIILDEADSMTESAQQALRVIISDSSMTTRFVFACNDSNKIIAPIQSRCNMLRFSKLKSGDIKANLLRIIKAESVKYDDEGLEALIDTSDGDMRYAVNNLQSTVTGFLSLTKENLYKIVDIPKPESLDSLLGMCRRGELEEVFKLVQTLQNDGYSILDVIGVFSKIVQNSKEISQSRIPLLKEISLIKSKISDGFDSKVQIYGYFCSLVLIANQIEK